MGLSAGLGSVRAGALVLLAALAFAASAASAPTRALGAPQLLNQFCKGGSGAGQCSIPRGLAVDPASGNVYVANQNNFRIEELTAWGEFIRAWGWRVVDGSPELQTCSEQTGCLSGSTGAGAGQFGNFGPQGVAIDSAGDVYVVDLSNRRVQKFDPSGAEVEFELMFGGEVNKTSGANICTQADLDADDVCGAGTTANPGTGEGQFGTWRIGSFIGVGPNDEIYVGDQERIQEFDSAGSFVGQIEGGDLATETVQSLAVDPTGDLYVSLFESLPNNSKNGVLKLDPSGADPSADSCASTDIAKVANPRGIAVDTAGSVYVIHGSQSISDSLRVHKFDSACAEIESPEFPFAPEDFSSSTALAASSGPTCGIDGTDLFISNSDALSSFVALYGPPPDIDICPPPEVPPSIEDAYAVSVDADAATLRAEINPNFWADARYYVQYGTAACPAGGWGPACSARPTPPGALLTDKILKATVTTAGVFLGGLEAETTYHYRFVAESSGGGPVFGEENTFTTSPSLSQPKADCPVNQRFRTGASARLPDCRAYEMVSPLDKNNGDIQTEVGFTLSSRDGKRASFSSYRAFGNPQSAPFFSQYLAERDPGDGWSTRSISPPRDDVSLYTTGGTGSELQFKSFTEDLCSGWVLQDSAITLAPGAPEGFPNLYRRLNGDVSTCEGKGYELLTSVPPPGFPAFEYIESVYVPEIQGFSSDATRSVFRADAALTADACTFPVAKEIFQVYETVGAGLRLVSRLPNGQAACGHSSAGTAQGLEGDFRADSVQGAVSSDASRVYWTATENQVPLDGGKGNQPGKLYLRINAAEEQSQVAGGKCSQPARACTYRVSELISPEPARFLSANPDGSEAIFSIETGPLAGLYRFTLDDGGSSPVTAAAPIATAGFKGLLGASKDLSRIYFVSTAVLSGAEENSHGDKALTGEPNLYLYERQSDEFTFVATLASVDVNNEVNQKGPPSPIALLPFLRISRVSPDGLHAAFTSAAPLVGNDNIDLISGEPDGEVFLYDAGAADLLCVSCNPTGERPVGRNLSPGVTAYWAAAQISPWEHQMGGSRALSEDGSRLFFESFNALVPRDGNGVKDVYEWERVDNRVQCEKEIGGELFISHKNSSGCLSLISSGQSPEDSEFVDASADGSNAFILTNASLVPQDPGLVDVYDARVDGGFPAPPSAEPECEGEACQSPPAAPNLITPSSSTFQGKGNPRPPKGKKRRCAKGKHRVRRAGKVRCVKKKRVKRHARPRQGSKR